MRVASDVKIKTMVCVFLFAAALDLLLENNNNECLNEDAAAQ